MRSEILKFLKLSFLSFLLLGMGIAGAALAADAPGARVDVNAGVNLTHFGGWSPK
jgi:hypothetical protein